ncbi:MAG: PLD nuclease N-terminal domain-containing protein [Candidatus Limnocylindria bacterium]
MLFFDGVVGVILIAFLLFCLLDVITTDSAEVRNLPKIAWVLIVFINPIGGIAWIIAGRPQDASRVGGMPYKGSRGTARRQHPSAGFPEHERPRTLAPDDDPEFLADLKRSNSEHERMLGSWEEDLRKREEDLRKNKDKDDDPPS